MYPDDQIFLRTYYKGQYQEPISRIHLIEPHLYLPTQKVPMTVKHSSIPKNNITAKMNTW